MRLFGRDLGRGRAPRSPVVEALEPLDDAVLVVTASRDRYEDLFRPAVRAASLPDGRALRPIRVDPGRMEELASDAVLETLEAAAAVLVDLRELAPDAFPLFAWHARARPRRVILLRLGAVALPFELTEHPVRTLDPAGPGGPAACRTSLSRLATLAAGARVEGLLAPGRLPRRIGTPSIHEILAAADRSVLGGAPEDALARLELAHGTGVASADLELRLALLARDGGRSDLACAAAERAIEAVSDCAPAWRELGSALESLGEPGAREAFARAVELDGDYAALLAGASLARREGRLEEALRLLERATEASEGQRNLVLPVAVLRAARGAPWPLHGAEAERVREVLDIRGAQALREPPEDAPWSAFDASTAALLLGDEASAANFAAMGRAHVHAPWQAETLARSLDALAAAGAPVAAARDALGVVVRAAPVAPPAPPRGPSRPYVGHARDGAWFAANVPCATACPVGTDAGTYVALASRGRFAEAYKAARAPNPFASVCGHVCAAPCESACRRGKLDAPVSIRNLKRFLTERHGPESTDSLLPDVLSGARPPGIEGEATVSHLARLGAGRRAGRRVAVAGGGPAGLACAHDLAFLGHRVTVFEASDRLGGMMVHGIPEHRLPRSVIDAEIAAILDLGVEVRLGEGLGADRTLASLLLQGYEAVFLASGAGRGRGLEVDGGGLDGVVKAIDFLINVNAGYRLDLGRRVVVVGGGNVAIDVARTARLGRTPGPFPTKEARVAAKALGPNVRADVLRDAVKGEAREVHIVARPPFGRWPAQGNLHGREEVDEARREGVVMHPLRGVRRILGKEGRVVGVELAEVLDTPDRRQGGGPLYGSHVAETIPCDAVLLAVGQEPDLDYLEGTEGLRRTDAGLIEVDRVTLSTGVPGVFAGGDAAFGPRTLIEAVAEGKRAARGIHAFLEGPRVLPRAHTFEEIHPRGIQANAAYDVLPRVEPACVAVERRTGITEVETAYDEATAVTQASRCLECHVQTIYDGSLCIACGRCVDVCPYRCLSFVPLEDVEARGPETLDRAPPGDA